MNILYAKRADAAVIGKIDNSAVIGLLFFPLGLSKTALPLVCPRPRRDADKGFPSVLKAALTASSGVTLGVVDKVNPATTSPVATWMISPSLFIVNLICALNTSIPFSV